MDDNEFTCDYKDCLLAFPTRPQLTIHKKKHEMMLTLNKANWPSTDETPTPTRFIRNCEEIGLFQDLQNVNPFEETFKKAVEGVKRDMKTPLGSYLSKSAGEDLHTPHVFPEISESVPVETGELTRVTEDLKEEEVVVRSEADTSLDIPTIQPIPSPILVPHIDQTSQDPLKMDEPLQVLFRMPNGSLIQFSTRPVAKDSTESIEDSIIHNSSVKSSSDGGTVILTTHQYPTNLVKKNQSPSPLVKEKLKAFLGHSSKKSISAAELKKKTVKPKPKKIERETLRKSDESCDETERERRKKILERNRVAAFRCREKRKRWVEDLARKSDQMAASNRALVLEVTSLREEVLRLKRLLLAHASCPVTLAAAASAPPITAVPPASKTVGSPSILKRVRDGFPREGLTLNIVKASENILMDLDSPSIVRRDEVLASVAPPSTPDRLVNFSELERESELELDDRQMSSTATVIQINPNVVRPNSFS